MSDIPSELAEVKQQIASLTELVTKLITKPKKPRTKTIKKTRTTNTKTVPNIQEVKSELVKPQTNIVSLIEQKFSNNSDTNPRRQQKGKQCRTESFNTNCNRPNTFLTSGLANSFKSDIETDKKLRGISQPSPRRPTVTMYKVACSKCGNEDIISGDMIMPDPESGEVRYICDSCIRSQR